MQRLMAPLRFLLRSLCMMALTVITRRTARARTPRAARSTATQQWVAATRRTPFSSRMGVHGAGRPEERAVHLATRALSAASRTPRLRTWVVTSRRTAAWTARWQKSARPAARCMCPCRPWPCTSSRTTFGTSAMFAAKRSAVLGCCRATCVLTRERSLSVARTAGRRLPTAPTCARTCRRIRPSNTSSARAAARRSRSSRTWTNTTSRLASRAHCRRSKRDFG